MGGRRYDCPPALLLCVLQMDMDRGSLAPDAQTETDSCKWITVGLHVEVGFVMS